MLKHDENLDKSKVIKNKEIFGTENKVRMNLTPGESAIKTNENHHEPIGYL